MIVEPAPHKAEKALRIVGAREFLAHHAHELALSTYMGHARLESTYW